MSTWPYKVVSALIVAMAAVSMLAATGSASASSDHGVVLIAEQAQQDTPAQILRTVCSALMEVHDISGLECRPNAYFADDLGLDDLDQVRLIQHLESYYEMKIQYEIGELLTVGELVNYIYEHQPQ
ncbi:phosphopantetheine-binding protein [Actinophytocola gossypii]|uniref:Carrier domain-containing protein n=1 Tax=Actinophytocola gossypii TaxID=2812003 RepID=A0ABT2JE98_9PSEU|nr:phosphopantetheine-binding protein [Actinophytocola gossypii]MCT2585594.1 hypothetical protein [Actinophytocola gossypii]